MSGIAGIFHRDGQPVNPEDLTRMIDRIAHRGPDGAAIWHEGSVGLGHRMLWTTPESIHEKLPFYRSDAKVAITADARIDNRDELFSMLGIQESTDMVFSDSELILEAYLKWGEQVTDKIIGDFAFAIWDVQKQCLLCARDPMGVKPFYYYQSDKYFIFASEIKAIFCIQDIPRQINETRIAEFIVRKFHDGISTFYQNIVALPAAHRLLVSNLNVRKQQYWFLDPDNEIQLSSDREYEEAFRSIFFDAVRCRLRSAFPVSSTLSGGLDSSSISCTARSILNAESRPFLHTYSGIFPGLSYEDRRYIDERSYIHSVDNMGGSIPHHVRMDDISPLVDLDKILFHTDEPHAAGNLYLHWEFFKEARKSNVRIMLDGTDGDTAVSYGYDYLTELTRSLRIAELLKEVKNMSKVTSRSRKKILYEYSLKALIPDRLMSLVHNYVDRNSVYRQCINPDFSSKVKLAERLNHYQNNILSKGNPSRAEHCKSIQMPIFSLIYTLADLTSQHFGIEMRYPFADKRLIEFCIGLPSKQKFSHGWNRGIVRRALKDILPASITLRKGKANLSANFNRNLALYERNTIENMPVSKCEIIQQFYNYDYYINLCGKYLVQPRKHTFEALTIFFSVILQHWLWQNQR